MAVESFACEETIVEPLETSEQAIGLIDELGLDGQRTFIQPAGKTGIQTR